MGGTAAPEVATRRQSPVPVAVVLVAAAVLYLCMDALAGLSPRFFYGGDPLERPFITLVALLVTAGIMYLVAVAGLLRLPARPALLLCVLGVGVALRAVVFFSSPILEDDFYRYLWDGGVAASGHNPYAYIPSDILEANEGGAIPEDLKALAEQAGIVAQRVNHPELGTIYPPIAQAAFVLAHWLRPWNLTAWRLVLLGFDVAVLGLLLLLLRKLGKPLHHAAIYWWNPLVVRETLSSAHMDTIVLPFVLCALLFVLAHRPIRASIALAISIGAKVWPLLLIPLMLRAIPGLPRRKLVAVILSALLLVLLFLPLLPALDLGSDSGFLAYGQRWEMNDALFMVFAKPTELLCSAVGLGDDERLVNLLSRAVVLTVLLLWIAWVTRGEILGPQDLCNRALFIVAGLFLLSPTQFPWYYLWMVPFLTLSPRPSLLLLTAMLPLYYLKFYFSAHGNVDLFHNGVVWIEYAPVWLLILWEWRAHRRSDAAQAA